MIHGKEAASIVTIADSSYSTELRLVLINTFVERFDQLTLVCFKNHPTFYEEHVPKFRSARITCIDCFSNPIGWDLITNQNGYKQMNITGDILSAISETLPIASEHSLSMVKCCVLIDDLDLLLRKRRLVDICSLLMSSASKVNQVVAFFNPDITDEVKSKSIAYVSSAYISVASVGEGHSNFEGRCILKKTSKKIINETSIYTIRNQTIHKLKSDRLTKDIMKEEKADEHDPAANLTFNLHLSETEKEARASMPLPYILDNRSKSLHLDGNIKVTGEIIYEPDDADDFDEEDPDDDLDI